MDLEKLKQEKKLEELINFGILIINKPSNWTSFDVVAKVRNLLKDFKLKKAGHFGTLDPNVTGVLPIGLGDTCKIQNHFMKKNKTYIGKMKLHKKVSEQQLVNSMKEFIGKINQLPPVKSSVKRKLRQREVIRFELVKYNENESEFIAEVEAGTYIRKLVHDIGENLKIGAHMTELHRIQAGLFSEKDKEYCSLEDLSNAIEEYKNGSESKLRNLIVPGEVILKLLPVFEVKSEFIEKLMNGSPLFKEMLENQEDIEKIKSIKTPFCLISNDTLIETSVITSQFKNKDILAKPEQVLYKQKP